MTAPQEAGTGTDQEGPAVSTTTAEAPAGVSARPKPKARGRPRKPVHVDQGEQGINLPPKPKDKHPGDAIRVLPVRGKTTADAEQGDFAIIQGVDTPWEAGALRLVGGLKAPIKKKIDFRHAKSGAWLGQYVTVKPEPGRKYSVWVVQDS